MGYDEQIDFGGGFEDGTDYSVGAMRESLYLTVIVLQFSCLPSVKSSFR